jgi:hypothetical protein
VYLSSFPHCRPRYVCSATYVGRFDGFSEYVGSVDIIFYDFAIKEFEGVMMMAQIKMQGFDWMQT